jgi:hypothetical protein
MANIIQIKRSTGSSAPTGLAAGEMAWYDGGGGSGANGKLFVGDVADGTAQHIGGRGTGAIGGGAASSLAADDLSAGDAAVTISTTSGNITVDATANNSDIIFKGTDATADITMLTLDGSEAGAATFNNKVVATQLDIGSGGADIDGALEANSYTVAGVALNEYIADTAGAMFSSNTESGITATYQDADNTIDLTVGTLNQNTTGSAATLTTARTIGGVSFNGSANIALVSGSIPDNAADTTGLAATATALATARTIGGVSFDGSANIALVSGSIPNNAADTTGLAATATALATARTIGGVSFNGSANIDLPGVNSAGNQATSSTSAGLSGTPNIAVGTVATTTLTASTAIKLGDSDDLIFGAGSDIIMSHEGSAASADAEIAGRIEGTSDHLGYTANSLVISNITDDGDIAFFVSDGGNSMGQLKLTAADNKVRIGGGAALEGEGSTTLNGFTIDGGTF